MYSNNIILVIFSVTDERSGNVPRRFAGIEPKENEKRIIWETNVLGTFPEGSLGTNQKRTKNEPSSIWETNVLRTFPECSLGTNQNRTKNEPVTYERSTFWERSQNVPRWFVENEPWENQKRTFVERSVLAGFPVVTWVARSFWTAPEYCKKNHGKSTYEPHNRTTRLNTDYTNDTEDKLGPTRKRPDRKLDFGNETGDAGKSRWVCSFLSPTTTDHHTTKYTQHEPKKPRKTTRRTCIRNTRKPRQYLLWQAGLHGPYQWRHIDEALSRTSRQRHHK